MAGLGGLQRGLRGLGVAQLADQDHVGVLAQRAAERLVERVGVEPDLALVDDAADVLVEDLDRILDRDDVLLARAVDVIDHRRERRRLSGAGRAGDEHEAAVLARELLHARRQGERLEGRDGLRNDAERERDRAALAEAVDAEARQIAGLVGDVELAVGAEGLEALRHGFRHAPQDGFELGDGQRGRAFQDVERAVTAQDGRAADLEVHVARAQFDRAGKKEVEIHPLRFGTEGPLL